MKTLTLQLPETVESSEEELQLLFACALYQNSKASAEQSAALIGLSKAAFLELIELYGFSTFGLEEQVRAITDRIHDTYSEQDAIFDTLQYGGGPGESFIRANKAGIRLFASHLLKASLSFDEILASKEKNIVPIDLDWGGSSQTSIDYIEPTDAINQEELLVPSANPSWLSFPKTRDDVVGLFWALVFFSIPVFALIGLGTAISWLFK